MRRFPSPLPRMLIPLLLFILLSGVISVQAAVDSSRVGANLSMPAAPAGFGYGVNFGNPSGWNNKGLSTVAARAGANSARIKLPEYHFDRWGYDIESTNGNMAAYQTNGLSNLTGFLIGPIAAHSTSPTGGSLDQYSPKNLYQPIWSSPGVVNPNNYWANFVYQVVSRYKGQVKIWEVWNEPDLTNNWSLTQGAWWSSPPNPGDLPNWHDTIFAYIRLLRVTYEVAKAVDPNCFIATGGIGYESFLDALLRYTDNPADGSITSAYPARGGAWFDAVSYHHYPHYSTYDQANNNWIRGTDSDAMATSFVARKNTLQMQLDRYGYNGSTYPRKLWLATESGVSSKPIGSLAGGVELQRNYLLKLAVLAQANGVSQVDWFQLADTEADSSSSSTYAHMGWYYDLRGLTVDTAQLKASGTALKSYRESILGQSYDSAATAALGLPSGARGYVFRLPDNRKSYVLWAATANNSEAASATVQLPTTVSLMERHWDYSSTRWTRTLSPSGGSVTINLSSSPVFLIETSASGTSPTNTPTATSTLAKTGTPTQTTLPTMTPAPSPTPTATPSTGGVVSGSERMVNGGFESGLTNWYIPSWFGGVAGVDSSQARSGSKALRFQGSSSGPYAYQEVPASPGEQANFSGWIYVPQLNGTMSMVIDLVPRHQYNGDLAIAMLATITAPTSGWVKISGSAVMPDRTASVRLCVRFPSLNGTAYLDDLSLQFGSGSVVAPTAAPTSTPPAVATPTATAQPTVAPTVTPAPTSSIGNQLLINGGFEGGLSNWYIPSWFASAASTDGTVIRSGSKVLQFKGNTNGPYLYQEIDVSPGQKIDFSGWMNITERYSDSSMVVELIARSSYNSNLAIVPITSNTNLTNGWVNIAGSAVMPNGTAKLRLQIRFSKLHGTVYFDDLSITGN